MIFESHSEHLLRRLQRRIAEKKISPHDAKLYFCDVSSGVSKLVPLELNLFGDIRNWPEDFFGDDYGEIAATAQAKMERQAEQPS
jgi:predicted ATPase